MLDAMKHSHRPVLFLYAIVRPVLQIVVSVFTQRLPEARLKRAAAGSALFGYLYQSLRAGIVWKRKCLRTLARPGFYGIVVLDNVFTSLGKRDCGDWTLQSHGQTNP